jgi:hypothetical protein
MANHAEEECTRNEVSAPEGVTVHVVKDEDGRLRGHMIVIGSLEVVATIAPFLQMFGLSPEGIASVVALITFTSPVMIPIMLFVDAVGSLSLIKLEDLIGRHFHSAATQAMEE